jgi:hypothetical protein
MRPSANVIKVAFKLCELERSLDLAGVQALDGFADEFVMHAPPGTLTPPQQSAEPSPASVDESVTPAQ